MIGVEDKGEGLINEILARFPLSFFVSLPHTPTEYQVTVYHVFTSLCLCFFINLSLYVCMFPFISYVKGS